ncbi:MAG: glycosyltransferase family 4 protein [Burkholderiales bacterium]|nr:glycosyltransferase family 4 protein [Burkholderiales bacterium]
MKIMYVINSFGAGGAERHLFELVKFMLNGGHSVTVVALTKKTSGGASNMKDDFVSLGVEVIFLDFDGGDWLGEFGRWINLYKTVKRCQPQIIHTHLVRADFSVSIIKRALPDFVWICTAHDAYIKKVYSGYWVFYLLAMQWRLADHIISVSGHARKWVSKTVRQPENKSSIIYHGVDVTMEDSRVPKEIGPNNEIVIGCLARYEPRKGIATLVKAMVIILQKFPRARLVVAGSNPHGYSGELRRLARKLHIEHAVDIGEFCDTPHAFMREIDIFAFASVSEGFGIVLLEAMAAGLPIVASDIYPLNYIVKQKETGLLASPNDDIGFSAAILELISNNKLMAQMGQAGRKRCSEYFSKKKMLTLTDNLYRDLINSAATGYSSKVK